MHQGHNWTIGTFKRPILQLHCLIVLLILNQDLRQDTVFNNPSRHTAAITAFCHFQCLTTYILNWLLFLFQPYLCSCCCWRSCSGLITLFLKQTEICVLKTVIWLWLPFKWWFEMDCALQLFTLCYLSPDLAGFMSGLGFV